MSQSTDYVLSNQSGANFRAELNSILAAIVSQNSGSTAPTTTYAYQWWIDTGVSPALLKIRNAANSSWITIGDTTAAGLGLLSAATAATIYAPLASPTFTGTVTIPSGASISGYLTTSTASSTYLALAGGTLAGPVTFSSGQVYPQIPANSKTAAYTLIASDAGKHISITTGGVTVPSAVFSIGDAISIFNNSASSQTITQGTSVTLRQGGTANTGNRTLAQYGVATLLCVASNTFVITGAGLS